MPLYPSGHELESVGIDGTGIAISKHLHINYSPLGVSKIPALTVSYSPNAITTTPGIRIISDANHTGDTISIERLEAGNFISLTYDGEEVLYAEDIGGLTAVSFVSGGSIKGTIQAITLLDIDAENVLLATKTISDDSVFTASSHRDGQLLYLLVTNSDGSDHDITFGSGFSADSVTVSASSTTLLSFINDGTSFFMVAGGTGGGSTLPPGTENQTLRYNNSNALVATSGLESYTDGQANTLDNDTSAVERLRNILHIEVGDIFPTAVDGSVLTIRNV
jgi:hypothetical protein